MELSKNTTSSLSTTTPMMDYGCLPGFQIKQSNTNNHYYYYYMIHEKRGQVIFCMDQKKILSIHQLYSLRYYSYWKQPTIPYYNTTTSPTKEQQQQQQQQLEDEIQISTHVRKQKNIYVSQTHSSSPIVSSKSSNDTSSTATTTKKKTKDCILLWAIIVVQSFCRMIQAKRQAKILVQKYYIKILDSSSKFYIYIDQRNGNQHYYKPFGLGCLLHDDIPLLTPPPQQQPQPIIPLSLLTNYHYAHLSEPLQESNTSSYNTNNNNYNIDYEFRSFDFKVGPFYQKKNGTVIQRKSNNRTIINTVNHDDDVENVETFVNNNDNVNIIKNKYQRIHHSTKMMDHHHHPINHSPDTTYSMIQNVYYKHGEKEVIKLLKENKENMDIIIYGLKTLSKLANFSTTTTTTDFSNDTTMEIIINECLNLLVYWQDQKKCGMVNVQIEAINVLLTISLESPYNRSAIDATNWYEIIIQNIWKGLEHPFHHPHLKATIDDDDEESTIKNDSTKQDNVRLVTSCYQLISVMAYDKEIRLKLCDQCIPLIMLSLKSINSSNSTSYRSSLLYHSCTALYNLTYENKDAISHERKQEYSNLLFSLQSDENDNVDEELKFVVNRVLYLFH